MTEAFKLLANSGKTMQQPKQCSFWERLKDEIEDKLKTAQPVRYFNLVHHDHFKSVKH